MISSSSMFAQCIALLFCSLHRNCIFFLSSDYRFSFFLASRAIGFSVKLQAIDHSMLQCFILFPLFVSDPDLAWAH